MSALIRIIGPCSGLQTPSLLIHSGQTKILINCGEGVQRCFFEHRKSLFNINHVLFTGVEAATVSGLCGFLLTTSDPELGETANSSKYTKYLMGPRGLARAIGSIRGFYFRNRTNPLNVIEFGNNYGEDITKAEATCMQGDTRNINEFSIVPLVVTDRYFVGRNPIVWPPYMNYTLLGDKVQDIKSFCSYIISIGRTRGKFLPEKARSFGIKPGKDFGSLSRGIPVKNDDGVLVQPEWCMDAKEKTKLCLVLDTSFGGLDELIHKLTRKYIFSRDLTRTGELTVVFHLASRDVCKSRKYKDGVMHKLDRGWGSGLQHVFIGKGYPFRNDVYLSSDILLNSYKKVAPNVFPTYIPDITNIQTKLECPDFVTTGNNSVLGTPLMEYEFFPGTNKLNFAEYMTYLKRFSLHDTSIIVRRNSTAEQSFFNVAPVDFAFEEDFTISFLGTGSSIPSIFRNVSGTALRIGELNKVGIMLDCGEGSLYQLYKVFGVAEAQEFLTNELKVVFISHMHADHHLGLISLLNERNKLLLRKGLKPTEKRILILCPISLQYFFHEMSSLQIGIEHTYNCIESHLTEQGYALDFQGHRLLLKGVPVVHVPESYGLVVSVTKTPPEHLSPPKKLKYTFKPDLKIVYSGDTRYSKRLVQAGLDCDVLIHEATFQSGMRSVAIAKNHSTFGEAIRVGKDMHAKRTVLVHFSQRYPISPSVSKSSDDVSYIPAYDLMTLSKETIQTAPKLLDTLQSFYVILE